MHVDGCFCCKSPDEGKAAKHFEAVDVFEPPRPVEVDAAVLIDVPPVAPSEFAENGAPQSRQQDALNNQEVAQQQALRLEEDKQEEKELEEAEVIEQEEEHELAEVKALVDQLKGDNEAERLQLSQRRQGFFVMAKDEEKDAIEKHGHGSQQHSLLAFLHHPRLQGFLVFLLLVDVVVVVVELFLEAQYPDCQNIIRDAVSCCPISGSTSRRVTAASEGEDFEGPASWLEDVLPFISTSLEPHGRLLGGDDLTCSNAGHVPLKRSKATCDDHKYPFLHTLHYVLVGTSVGILFIFLIELLLLLFCLHCAFFSNPLYIADFIIVTASLTLEFVLFKVSAQGIVSLMLFARFWRFVRIAHGLATSVHEPMHHKLKHSEAICDKLTSHIEKLTASNKKLDAAFHTMRLELEARSSQFSRMTTPG